MVKLPFKPVAIDDFKLAPALKVKATLPSIKFVARSNLDKLSTTILALLAVPPKVPPDLV